MHKEATTRQHGSRGLICALILAFLPGCSTPIGTDKASSRQVYSQMEENALITGQPSASTVSLLRRLDLLPLATHQPDEAVRRLHEKALETNERDLLFALAEMSYVAAERIRRSVKSWDLRDERDYYLGRLFTRTCSSSAKDKRRDSARFDRRSRAACDFYNFGAGPCPYQPTEAPMRSFTWKTVGAGCRRERSICGWT